MVFDMTPDAESHYGQVRIHVPPRDFPPVEFKQMAVEFIAPTPSGFCTHH
jgi:hypothetical protein